MQTRALTGRGAPCAPSCLPACLPAVPSRRGPPPLPLPPCPALPLTLCAAAAPPRRRPARWGLAFAAPLVGARLVLPGARQRCLQPAPRRRVDAGMGGGLRLVLHAPAGHQAEPTLSPRHPSSRPLPGRRQPAPPDGGGGGDPHRGAPPRWRARVLVHALRAQQAPPFCLAMPQQYCLAALPCRAAPRSCRPLRALYLAAARAHRVPGAHGLPGLGSPPQHPNRLQPQPPTTFPPCPLPALAVRAHRVPGPDGSPGAPGRAPGRPAPAHRGRRRLPAVRRRRPAAPRRTCTRAAENLRPRQHRLLSLAGFGASTAPRRCAPGPPATCRMPLCPAGAARRAVVDFFEDRGVEVRHCWGMTELAPLGTIGAPKVGAGTASGCRWAKGGVRSTGAGRHRRAQGGWGAWAGHARRAAAHWGGQEAAGWAPSTPWCKLDSSHNEPQCSSRVLGGA